MGIKTYNPYTPSRRQMTGSDFSEITKTTPEKSLLVPKEELDVTIRVKSLLDIAEAELRKNIELSTSRERKDNIHATVIGIEYDPNRTANIALICYEDGEKAYILAPEGLTDGMTVMNGAEAEVKSR